MMLPGDEFFREGDSIEVVSIQQEDIAFHQHPYLEMVYVTGGRGLHTLGRLETTVQKGDYFIVNYGTEHKYTMIGGQRFDLINVLFKPELIDKSLQRCPALRT